MNKWTMLFLGLMAFSLAGCQLENRGVVADQSYVKQSSVKRKPGAQLELENSQVNLEVAGVQYTINVGLFSGYSKGTIDFSVKASEGLYIVSGDESGTIGLGQSKLVLPYDVVATVEGRYYLYMNMSVDDGAGNVQGRALTFIVQVGPEPEVSGVLQKPEGVEYIKTLPVEEEVIQLAPK